MGEVSSQNTQDLAAQKIKNCVNDIVVNNVIKGSAVIKKIECVPFWLKIS